jgi:hypothetical protein
MTFADTSPRYPGARSGDFKRIEWLRLRPGRFTIRIMEAESRKVFAHWITGTGFIKCLDDDCPICQNNNKIRAENPKDFRSVSGWNPWTTRYYVNVFDRTSVKVCPDKECFTDNYMNDTKEWPTTCYKCGGLLIDVEPRPSDRIKVLTRGVTLFNTLQDIHEEITDEDDKLIGIMNYDVVLKVSGTGTDTTISVIADKGSNDKISFVDDDLFDLGEAV